MEKYPSDSLSKRETHADREKRSRRCVHRMQQLFKHNLLCHAMSFSQPLAYCSHINVLTGKHSCLNALLFFSGALRLSCSFPAPKYSRRNSTATRSNRSKKEREQEQPSQQESPRSQTGVMTGVPADCCHVLKGC